MPHLDHSDRESMSEGSFLTSRPGIALLALLTIAGFLLFTEHRAHVLGAGLFVLLLACPLLHLFMHGGHEGHRGNGDRSRAQHELGRSDT